MTLPLPEFPVLHTPRLTLRPITLADAEAIFRMRSNGRVNRFIARPAMADPASAVELVERTRAAYDQGQAIGWAGLLRDREEIIGTCGFNRIDLANRKAEIGGEMSTDWWGKHLALEAVTAILSFGLDQLNLNRVEAWVMPGNRGAIALLEHLDFRKEAHLREALLHGGEALDMAVYGLIRREARWWTA